MADADRIRDACERAIASLRTDRPRPVGIIGQTSPLYFPSRPAAPVPAYLRPDYVPRKRARLVEMAERVGLGDEVRRMLAWGESHDRA